MKDTKEKILAAALRLFNERGVSAVSSKHISDYMGISYGNLCYHFPKKDDLIVQLYLNMQAELDEQFLLMQQEIYGFKFMMKSLRAMLEVQLKYKFFYLGFTRITRDFDEIKRHALIQLENRRKLLRGIVDFLITEGYLRFEHKEGHYGHLIQVMLMLLNAWIPDSEAFYKGDHQSRVDVYLEMIYSFVRASLTQKGVDAFNEVYNNA